MHAYDVYADPVCESMAGMEGQHVSHDTAGWNILSPGDAGDTPMARVWARDTGKLVCCVWRRAIPQDLCDLAVRCYKAAGEMVSTNRGTAAGLAHRSHSSATPSYERGAAAHSSIVGFIDSTRHDRPCRLTTFSRDHFQTYQEGLPFIHAIDRCFAACVPGAHARQREEAQKTPFHIEGTAFSTVTVNLNFRTAIHRDAGDFPGGFGNLVVCSQNVSGGALLFPRYKVGVALETGDFLAMDVHEWHCNSPITRVPPSSNDAWYRLSFVCYLRARMDRCEAINERIQNTQERGRPTGTDALCSYIFEIAGEPAPAKEPLGAGPTGIPWWRMTGTRYVLTYRNKRYTLEDRATHRAIHNLWPAVEYAEACARHAAIGHDT